MRPFFAIRAVYGESDRVQLYGGNRAMELLARRSTQIRALADYANLNRLELPVLHAAHRPQPLRDPQERPIASHPIEYRLVMKYPHRLYFREAPVFAGTDSTRGLRIGLNDMTNRISRPSH